MALRVGATTALVVLLAIVSTAVIFDRQQLGEIRGRTETTARTADDVVDAPPGMWLVKLTPTGHEATRSMPAGLAAEVFRLGPTVSGQTSFSADGRMWPAWVDQRDGASYVAVYDFRLHTGEEQRLLISTIAAGVVGVLLAALTGLLAGRRAVRPLGEAMELQRQFVADASHELRTPLSVISIRAQLLRRHLRAQDRDNDLLSEVDQLVDDTKVMSDVVSDLLLSAQLDAGEATREPVNLVYVAEQVGRSLEPYAAEAGVTLTWPESATHRRVVVDGVSTSLRRAVLALVDNAVAHSPSGASVEVAVSVDDGSRMACVDVVDHGSGVDADNLEVLTRRFARAQAEEGAGRRSGLGLALVTQIVSSHGGSLDVVETSGGGATFRLVLPLATEDEDLA